MRVKVQVKFAVVRILRERISGDACIMLALSFTRIQSYKSRMQTQRDRMPIQALKILQFQYVQILGISQLTRLGISPLGKGKPNEPVQEKDFKKSAECLKLKLTKSVLSPGHLPCVC